MSKTINHPRYADQYASIVKRLMSSILKQVRFFLLKIGRTKVKVQDSRQRAIEACWILYDFVADLISGTRLLEIFESENFKKMAQPETIRVCNKVALSTIFISLSKWVEFYDRYHPVIPMSQLSAARALKTEIENRGIQRFRNTMVGHIWSEEHSRPLLNREIKELDEKITKGSPEEFLKWINDPTKKGIGTTVVETSEAIRNELKITWKLSEDEIRASRDA